MTWTDPAAVPPAPKTGADILREAPKWVQAFMLVLAAVWVIMVISMLASGSFNLLGFVIQVPLLTLITIPIARRIARYDRDPTQFWFVMAAFSAKMLGGLARYYFTYIAYVSVGDAEEYDAFGRFLVPHYRSFDFSPDVGQVPGTGSLKAITGVLYSIVGSSKLGGFMVFSWFGFVGLLLCWRAFKRAVPTGDARRYGLLVLFLPSLLYWSSALGKDAWVVMGLGLCAYGTARLMTRGRVLGLVLLVAGLLEVGFVRPHVALTVGSGLVLAALLYKPSKASPLNPIFRVLLFGFLLVLMLVLVSQTEKFLGVESLNQESVNSSLANAEGRTLEAGSAFTPVTVNTPLDMPYATITVLFRPFPWESHNGQTIATAVEGLFLVVLSIRGWRRLLSIPRSLRREPFVAYSLGITLTFVFAFSSFSNFGILARQRCQVMPFFLVLICLAQYKPKDPARPSGTEPGDLRMLATGTPDPYRTTSDAGRGPAPGDDG
jgi:hypothetical protein